MGCSDVRGKGGGGWTWDWVIRKGGRREGVAYHRGNGSRLAHALGNLGLKTRYGVPIFSQLGT